MLATSRKHQIPTFPIIIILIIFQNSDLFSNPTFNPTIPTLKAFDKLNGKGGPHHGVLPGGLLAPPPSGVPKNVDIRRPKGQPSLPIIVHGPGLDGDGGGDGGPERAVEGGGHEEDLGEGGGGGDGAIEGDAGAVGGEAVEGFGPPLVGGDAEAGDGGGVVGELADLLLESQMGYEGPGPAADGE